MKRQSLDLQTADLYAQQPSDEMHGKPHDKDRQGREQHEGCSLGQQDVCTAPGIDEENAHCAVPLLAGNGRRAHHEAHYCNDNGAERPKDIAYGQPTYVDIVTDAK